MLRWNLRVALVVVAVVVATAGPGVLIGFKW